MYERKTNLRKARKFGVEQVWEGAKESGRVASTKYNNILWYCKLQLRQFMEGAVRTKFYEKWRAARQKRITNSSSNNIHTHTWSFAFFRYIRGKHLALCLQCNGLCNAIQRHSVCMLAIHPRASMHDIQFTSKRHPKTRRSINFGWLLLFVSASELNKIIVFIYGLYLVMKKGWFCAHMHKRIHSLTHIWVETMITRFRIKCDFWVWFIVCEI